MSAPKDKLGEDKTDRLPCESSPPISIIAPHVANNALEFLRRVEMKGLEAFAFCEVYSTLQKFSATAGTTQGVPFAGVFK